jgi:acyl-CoA reductase-like NAD-dependent aldehyde dehydrogenase
LASVSGAKPVHPEIPMLTFTSSARAGADTRKAAVAAHIPRLRMMVSLSGS